jgi:DNA invertase Pin-like site-specific DNA recombinase
VRKIHEDKASGVLNGRKGLTQALKGCASGDVLVDRLARSLHDVVVIAEDLKGRGVGLKVLTGEGAAVDTTVKTLLVGPADNGCDFLARCLVVGVFVPWHGF